VLLPAESPTASAVSQAYLHLANLLEPPATAEEEEQIDNAFRDLRTFVRQAWHVLEPGVDYVHGPHIDAICDHLQAVTRGEIRRLIINVPPRHMKSLLVSVMWPTWEWLHIPEQRWIFASYSKFLSMRDNGKARLLIESPWFQKRWGHIIRLRRDTRGKGLFANSRTGFRYATSVSAGVTGEGGNRLVADDPHNVKQAESDAVRTRTLEWWDQAMSSRGNDPKKVARIVVMQRVHEQDLTGHCLLKGNYEHLCLPAEYDGKKRCTSIGNGKSYEWREQHNELLWPERFGEKEISELKTDLGPYGTAGQLQQAPAPAEGGYYKRYWWRYWCFAGQKDKLPPVLMRNKNGDFEQMPIVELPPFENWREFFDVLLQSWDMAFKDTKDSAFVVGQVWAKKGANKFLLDQIRDKLDMPQTIEALKALSLKWPLTFAKLVEDKANGPAVISTLRSSISGLIAYNPDGDKVARANAAIPQIASGNVYLPHPALCVFTETVINEAASFPNGTYKDQVDALNQALLYCESGALWRDSELEM
jgi:predicted phage terminase large subunit-like protein